VRGLKDVVKTGRTMATLRERALIVTLACSFAGTMC
jgi:hypothetical protein